MPDFKLSNINRPCPACGNTSGCKERNNNAQLAWLCRGFVGLGYKEKVQGHDGQVWINLNKKTGSDWALMAVDRSQEFTEEQRAAYEERLSREKEDRERRRVEALACEMSPEDRDLHYTKLLSELHLSARDREHLRGRGFSDTEIDATGFKSVEKYHKLNYSYPDNLPGYDFKFGGPQLQVHDTGILCPIKNHQGLIVGAQIRLSQVEDGKRRYRWLSQDGSGYLNGENPIACWEPTAPAEDAKLWLAEGTGIKPLLASLRLNAPVVGAAGGLFGSSPINTRNTLRYLSDKMGTRCLTVAVDAGDVVNPHVMQRLNYQFDWLQNEGYTIEIAWWGQVDKTAEDLDEVATFDGIEFLSVDDFLRIAAKYATPPAEKVQTPAPINRSDRKKEIKAAEQIANSEIPKLDLTIKKERPIGWNLWEKNRAYTPDQTQDDPFVRFSAPAPGSILAVKSGLGSGKTYQLGELFGAGGAYEGKGAIALFARNSLIYNFVKRIPSFSHLNEELLLLMRDPGSRLALCTNSLKKFTNPEWFDGKILIIDEFWAVALHIACSATHRKDRIASLALFKEAFERCESVIILDGMLTDWLVRWAGDQDPTKRIVKLENTLQRRKAKVEILLGTPTKSGGFDSNNLSPYVAPMLGSNAPFIVFSDSQKLLEQIEILLADAGKNGIRIDSKTVKKDSEERLCLDDCNEWIKLHRPDYILCSPTAESGVDISVWGYFKNSYGLFRGIIATDQQMQMMGRYRCPDCFWHISVPKQSFLRGSDRDYNLDNINAAAARLMELAEMDISHLRLNKDWLGDQFLGFIEEAKLDVNNTFALRARAKDSFEKENLRECLHFALESSGHEVTETALFAVGKTEAQLKIAGETVKKRAAEEIFNAEDIDEKQAEDIAAKWASTWEDRVKLIKASYKKQLPGIEESVLWSADLIQFLKYDEPKLISAAGLLHQFKNPESATRKQKNLWAKIATDRAIFLPDLHSPHLKIKALEFLNFEQFLDPDKTWTKDSPELKELCKNGARERIVNSIGFNVPTIIKGPSKGKPDAIRYLRKLLELVGLKLGPCSKKRQDGGILNTYSLDPTWLENPIWVEVQAAVERRYATFNDEWVLPEVLSVKVEEVPIESGLSPVADPDLSNEPEDLDGVDWRGFEFAIAKPVNISKLFIGDRVTVISQPRKKGDDDQNWLIWVKNAIGCFLLELGVLEMIFD